MNAHPLLSHTRTEPANVPMCTASIDARTKENYDLAPSDAPIIASPIKKSLPEALHLPPLDLSSEDTVLRCTNGHDHRPVTNPWSMTPIGVHYNRSIESKPFAIVEKDADPRWCVTTPIGSWDDEYESHTEIVS